METTVFSPEGKNNISRFPIKVEYYTQDGHTDFYFAVSLSFDVSLDNKDKEAKTDKIQLENKIGNLARKGKINERSNALS